jgi:acetyl-CoA acetyltransferase
MGLPSRAKGGDAVLEGWTEMGGKLPVNPSGGLKAKGHPIGATGVSMHVQLTAMQLTGGEAGGIQVKDADARRHLQHGRRGGRQLRVSCRPARSASLRTFANVSRWVVSRGT